MTTDLEVYRALDLLGRITTTEPAELASARLALVGHYARAEGVQVPELEQALPEHLRPLAAGTLAAKLPPLAVAALELAELPGFTDMHPRGRYLAAQRTAAALAATA